MNIPLNRWTLLALVAVGAIFGSDVLSALMRGVAAIGQAYVPAM